MEVEGEAAAGGRAAALMLVQVCFCVCVSLCCGARGLLSYRRWYNTYNTLCRKAISDRPTWPIFARSYS